jgi:ribose transport system substrate-binding protein
MKRNELLEKGSSCQRRFKAQLGEDSMCNWKKNILRSLICGAAVILMSTAGQAADKPKILVVYPYLGDQSFVRMHASSVAEAAKFPEIQIDIVAGPDRTNVEYFINSINKAVTERYNVIVLNHGGAAAQLYPALRKAQDQGVKVVAFDTGLPDLAGHSADILYDNYAAAKVAGSLFVSLLPQGGKIGILRCLLGNPDTDAFVNGFKDAIKGTKITVVAEADSKCDPAQSRTMAENMLTANPDLVGIYDSVDVSAQGSLQALKAAHSKAILGSIGGQLYGAQAIASGTNWKFSVPYRFEEIGKVAVDTGVAVAKGETVPAKVIIPPAQPVTPENAAGYVKDLKAQLSH